MRFLQFIFLFTFHVQLFANDQAPSKKDSLIALYDSIQSNDTSSVYKLLFFQTFPNSFQSMQLYYEYGGLLADQSYEHQGLFLKIIRDTSIISKDLAVQKIIKIISNYQPSVDNLGYFYKVVGNYIKKCISISDLIRLTTKLERDSLIIFIGQSNYPPGIQLLESYLLDKRMTEHHSLIKSTLADIEKRHQMDVKD